MNEVAVGDEDIRRALHRRAVDAREDLGADLLGKLERLRAMLFAVVATLDDLLKPRPVRFHDRVFKGSECVANRKQEAVAIRGRDIDEALLFMNEAPQELERGRQELHAPGASDQLMGNERSVPEPPRRR